MHPCDCIPPTRLRVDFSSKVYLTMVDRVFSVSMHSLLDASDIIIVLLFVPPPLCCSGLYPQLAVPDDCNSYHRESDQVYHTKVNAAT